MMLNVATRQFDPLVINELESLMLAEDWDQGYTLLSNVLKTDDPATGEAYTAAAASIHQAQLFLEGAARVNAGLGVFSAFIRTYTETQGVLRHGELIPASEMQEASNAVAESILTFVRDDSLPTIEEIADRDALEIRDVLFPELGDDNPAWSGVLLYAGFGSSQVYRLAEADTEVTAWNMVCCGVSARFAWEGAVDAAQHDPLEVLLGDGPVLRGLVGLWDQHWDDLIDPSGVFDLGALQPATLDGTPIDPDQLIANSGLDDVTYRFHIVSGGTADGAAGGVEEMFVVGSKAPSSTPMAAPISSSAATATMRSTVARGTASSPAAPATTTCSTTRASICSAAGPATMCWMRSPTAPRSRAAPATT